MSLFPHHRRAVLVGGVATVAAATVVGLGLAAALPASGPPAQPTTQPITQPAAQSTVVQAPALPAAPPISARDRVYTADQTSNTVSVVDPSTNQVLGTIPLGAQRLGDVLGPQYLDAVDVHGLGFSRDGRYLDVISVTTNTVTVLRTADNTVVSQTNVGRAAHEGFFTPDGTQVWVADRALSRIELVDAVNGGVVGSIDTDAGPSKVLFSPDGKLAYVNHIRSATIDVIEVASRQVVGRIDGLADVFSSDMGLSPDGQQLWVGHKKTGKVSIIATPTRKVTSVLDTGPGTNHPNFVTTAQGAYVYLTVGGLDETKIYQRHGDSAPTYVGAVKASGTEPHGIWPSPDNTRAYVVNERSDTVDVIDTASRTVLTTLPVGQEGQALVYVADAVPTGPGTQNLTRQGLDRQVANAPAHVHGPGAVRVTVRAITGLDMVQLSADRLQANTRHTVYGCRGDQQIPLLSFTTDAMGAKPQALAFLQFFGVYDINSITVRPAGPGSGPTATAPGSGSSPPGPATPDSEH